MLRKISLFLTLLLISSTAAAASCDIEPTSDGKFGVRELRASGYVYLVRGLSYDQALKALTKLQALGRCD